MNRVIAVLIFMVHSGYTFWLIWRPRISS